MGVIRSPLIVFGIRLIQSVHSLKKRGEFANFLMGATICNIFWVATAIGICALIGCIAWAREIPPSLE